MNWPEFIGQYDLIYEIPPREWSDGFLLGNGGLGALVSVPHALEWLVNKVDVLDARVAGVKRIIPPDEAKQMIRNGATGHDFNREERGDPPPSGSGPKSCCRLTMDLGATAGGSRRGGMPAVSSRLSLYDATLNIALDKHLFHPRVTSFVRDDEDMLIIRVRDKSPLVAFGTTIYLNRPEDAELPDAAVMVEQDRLIMEMEMPEAGRYVVGLQVIPRPMQAYRPDLLLRLRKQYRTPEIGGCQLSVQGRHGIVNVGGDFDLLLTVATVRDAKDPRAEVHRRLERAAATTFEALYHDHAAWWARFWQKSWVELGDKSREQLFYMSLYMLGSTFRHGPMPAILGLTYGPYLGSVQITPWGGAYANDLNIQCPFFPVHALNHSELFDAYLDTHAALLPVARQLARSIHGVDGVHFDSFNILGKLVAGGVGAPRYCLMSSYVALMHCLCWRYRRDISQLRDRIYPFLKEVLDFYLSLMGLGKDGHYHLWPGYAVEIDIINASDPVQTMSMLKVCVATALEASKILGVDADQAVRWQDLLDHFPAYPTAVDWRGREVVLEGVGIPANHHVGQAGCLHPLYPCGEIDEFADPALFALYQRTYESVLDKTAEKVYAIDHDFFYMCAWECFFRGMAALRLGRTEEFWQVYMPMMLRAYSKPNGMMSHDGHVVVDPAASEANLATIPDYALEDCGQRMPVFEPWHGHAGTSSPDPRIKEFSHPLIEVNGDYLTMMTETLLQSHNGIIRLFPGWPRARDAQFVNLVAEGHIGVSARLADGEVQFVTLRRPGEIALPGDSPEIRIISPWTGQMETWPLPPGTTLMLTKDGPVDHLPEQIPSPMEPAQPRVLYADPHATLWLGRKRS